MTTLATTGTGANTGPQVALSSTDTPAGGSQASGTAKATRKLRATRAGHSGTRLPLAVRRARLPEHGANHDRGPFAARWDHDTNRACHWRIGYRAHLTNRSSSSNLLAPRVPLEFGRVGPRSPDGYTIGIGQWCSHVANGAIYKLP